MKIVTDDKTEISTILAVTEAALFSGVDAVSIEIVPSDSMFCPVVDCGECEFTSCTSSLQRARVMTAAEAQHEYDVLMEKLKHAELNIRLAANARG